MFFNPLFIDSNSSALVQGQKGFKLGKSQYLFSDIIKISISQSESADAGSAPAFNLSLINGMANSNSSQTSAISSLVKGAISTDSKQESTDSMLANFLQLAFVNQNVQIPDTVNFKDLVKNKEILLSKDALTGALAQLLQAYQTADGQPSAANTANAASNLAGQIFSSLEDKGKVVLNFKNPGSQIKVELSKLSSQDKELFVSTKIIPMFISDAPQSGTDSATADKKISSGSAAALQNSETGDVNNAQEVNDGTGKGNLNTSDNNADEMTAKILQMPAEALPVSDSDAQSMEANTQEQLQNAQAQQQAATVQQQVPPNVNVNIQPDVAVNNVPADTGANKSDSVSQKGNTKAEPQNGNEEYKFKVVEVNTDKVQKEQEAKIFAMSPFEKNILKKSTITVNTPDSNTTADKSETVKAETQNSGPGLEAKTVAQSEQKILETNNMLFDKAGNVKADNKETVKKTDENNTGAPVKKDSPADPNSVKANDKTAIKTDDTIKDLKNTDSK